MPNNPLIFPGSNVEQRLRNLFRDFGAPDSAKLKAFVDDPTGTVVSELYPEAAAQIPAQRLSDANKFLFSATGNPTFKAWLSQYQNGLAAKINAPENQGKTVSEIVSKDQVMKDFASALAESGDATLIHDYSRILAGSPVAIDSVFHSDTVATYTAAVAAVVVILIVIDFNFRVPEPLSDIALTPEQIRGIAEALTNRPR